jgi:excisionase family DNA binding protein
MIQSIVETYLESRINNRDNSTIEILTVSDLATLLKISNPVAYDLVARSDFPSFKIGKSIRVSKSELTNWIVNQSAKEKGE